MTSLLSDYQILKGIFLADPEGTSLKDIRKDMENVLRLDTARLEKRLEETLKEIDTMPEEKIGRFALQGLLRGAYFAACVLKTRSRTLLKQTKTKITKDKLDGVIHACEQLQEDLSRHHLAPECVKIARFSHRPFRKVVEDLARSRDEALVSSSHVMNVKEGPSDSWDRIRQKVTNAAYLPI